MKNLKEVICSITARCNLRCRMCDIPYEKKDELSTLHWKRIISDASRLGAQTIVFSGGEPLLRDDIFELVSYAKNNNLSACITSNGSLLDEKSVLRLKSSGVTVVNISLEGRKETHDNLRGRGAFDRAILALENLRKYKIEATVASTVSKYNYKDLFYVLELAKNYGATTVRFQPFNNIFLKSPSRENEFLINKTDALKLKEIIEKLISGAKEFNISTNPISYLNNIPAYLAGEKIFPGNCPALYCSCPINPDGEMFPCWIESSRDNLIGNLKDESLYDLWLSQRRMNIINSIAKKGCSGCMMSCYDEVFGRDVLQTQVFKKIKRISRTFNYEKIVNKILQKLRGEFTKLRLRCKFYLSYRGSVRTLFKRRFLNIFSRRKNYQVNRGIEKPVILQEIDLARQRLKKEMNSL